ncbi:MAG: hypothetical protein NTW14_07360 [bacterium]|nr:hypothetical protein [bacterium]
MKRYQQTSLRVTVVLACFIGVIVLAQAQVTLQWVDRQATPDHYNTWGCGVGSDSLGNVYISGLCEYRRNFLTIKYSPSGAVLWRRILPAPNLDSYPSDMIVDASGNVYITGTMNSDYVLLKYNNSGQLQWTVSFNGTGDGIDVATALEMDDLGYVYVTGYSAGITPDYLTIKYNPQGVVQWNVRYNGIGNGDDRAVDLAIDGEGSVYVTGYSDRDSNYPVNYDYTTIKYDSQGNQQWVASYNGTGNGADQPSKLALDANTNVIVTGISLGVGTEEDCATIKYNSLGTQEWVMRYNSPTPITDTATDLGIDAQNNIVVTGNTGEDIYTKCFIIKYGRDGAIRWIYEGSYFSGFNALVLDSEGNVYVAGFKGAYLTADLIVVKYDPQGEVLWRENYDTRNMEMGYFISLDRSSDVLVNGIFRYVGQIDYQCLTLKYRQFSGDEYITEEVDAQAEFDNPSSRIFGASPNPFNPTTVIRFTLPEAGRVSLDVFDINGRLVGAHGMRPSAGGGSEGARRAPLQETWYPAGEHEVTFDGSGLAAGVYVYRLTTSGSGAIQTTLTGKMVLLK